MTLEITVSANLGEYSLDCNVEIGSDEFIQEQIFDQLTEKYPEMEDDEQAGVNEIKWDVIDWNELSDYENLQKELEELADYSGYNELDVISAARDCGIDYENIDEAYSGSCKNDEDFAEETAESLGYIDRDLHWPFTCIDWEQAASELMQDYRESNGFYFRLF